LLQNFNPSGLQGSYSQVHHKTKNRQRKAGYNPNMTGGMPKPLLDGLQFHANSGGH